MLHYLLPAARKHELLAELELSHYMAALKNPNASSQIAVTTYVASGSITNAIAAASLAQGALHAPVTQARALLDSGFMASAVRGIISAHQRVPGFGNSFHKDRIDPMFAPVFEQLPDEMRDEINDAARVIGKNVFPNAAIITAAAAKHCGLPAGTEPAIFVYARIPAWVQLCLKQKTPKVGTP